MRQCVLSALSYRDQSFAQRGLKSGTNVKVINDEEGTIGVRFGPTGNELPLQVNTTASGN